MRSCRSRAVLALVGAGVLLLSIPGGARAADTIRYPFIAGTFVIPMDAQQADVLHAFGLVHAILRAGIPAYRVLSPPAVLLKTDPFSPPAPFDGPILVWGTYRTEFLAAAAAYPNVTYLQLSELQILDNVLPIRRPTSVLVLQGRFDWGHTEVLLAQLGIPYDLRPIADVVADPTLLYSYALVVDDCDGWAGEDPGPAVDRAFDGFVQGGGHVVFTDIALKDMAVLFPGHIALFGGTRGTFQATVHTHGDAPSQYSGPGTILVYTEIDGVVMGRPLADDVRVLIDLPDYPSGYQRTEYRALAAYFPVGSGTVEGFAYHPFEQTGASFNFSSILYGNTFVTSVPFLPPAPPPAPNALGLPTPPPTPPVPPPPPPLPGLPVVNMAYAGYLFAGFTGVGMADIVRNRLRLRSRTKVAMRV